MKDKAKRLDPCRISDEELREGQEFIFPDFGTPEILKTVTPTSELPDRKPSLLDQHPFSALVFDTEIHLLP